jgi:hypothetical protein
LRDKTFAGFPCILFKNPSAFALAAVRAEGLKETSAGIVDERL